MKNMVLLIDANVLLNYLLNRGVECDYAMTVINFCRKGKARGYMAFHTVSILWYALRKKPVQERRELLLDLCKIINVAGVSHDSVMSALENEAFSDFEDCLQEKCAEACNARYIVTENIKDYKTSTVPAITATEMVDILLSMER